MNLLPDNPTPFDYLHAIRAVASRAGLKEIFNLADRGMFANDELKKETIAALEWAQQNLGKHTRPSPVDNILAKLRQ
jgi:hypothetical protein